MKKTGKKSKKVKKLVQSARHLAEEIAFQNTVHANLDYCLDTHTLCRVRLAHDSWTAARIWWVLSLSRDYVYAAHVTGFQLDGYEIVPIGCIAEAIPMVHYTDQCSMMELAFPEDYPDLELVSLPQLFADLGALECCIQIGHEEAREENSHTVVGRIEKIGKKRVTIRGLGLDDLAWQIKPDKFLYEEVNRIVFGTQQINGYEKLAMSYEAFIRTVNESVRPPEELDDFEEGRDLRDVQSEDMVDIDELQSAEDNSEPETVTELLEEESEL